MVLDVVVLSTERTLDHSVVYTQARTDELVILVSGKYREVVSILISSKDHRTIVY